MKQCFYFESSIIADHCVILVISVLFNLDLVSIFQCTTELLNRNNLQGNQVVEKLDSLVVLTFLHLEPCQSSGRLAEVFPTTHSCMQITHPT